MATQPSLEVGELVHVMHRNCAKHDPLWNPGFRITHKISDTCFEVFHSGTRTRLIRNVQHLKLAEPMELILDNTSVNILPSRSQLYMRDEHLLDLQWLFTKHKVQLSDLFTNRATQTTRRQSPAATSTIHEGKETPQTSTHTTTATRGETLHPRAHDHPMSGP